MKHLFSPVDHAPVRGRWACRACRGTGILQGLQWGSSEWPGCSVCAPHYTCIGSIRSPENIAPAGIGTRGALRTWRRLVGFVTRYPQGVAIEPRSAT